MQQSKVLSQRAHSMDAAQHHLLAETHPLRINTSATQLMIG